MGGGGDFAYFVIYAHIKNNVQGGGGVGQKWLNCCVRMDVPW